MLAAGEEKMRRLHQDLKGRSAADVTKNWSTATTKSECYGKCISVSKRQVSYSS